MKNNIDLNAFPHTPIITSDIAAVIERDIKVGNDKPPLFLALYGIGKSYQMQAVSKKMGYHYIDYRAPFKTFNDVRGFGVPNHESKKMEFYLDEDFALIEGQKNFIHFEELLNASSPVQKVLMQVFLDRILGGEPLPEDTYMTASSNRRTHQTGVEQMLAALADRLSIYHVRPDLDSFMSYMDENGRSPETLAFLQVNSEMPYDFGQHKWDGESNFPTFRSIEALDKFAASYNDTEEMANDPLLAAQASAKVGPKYGPMFAQFVRLSNSIGDIDKMIDEADTCKIPVETDLRWIIACRLITAADKNRLANVLTLSHRLSEPTETDWTVNDEPSAMQTFVCTSIRRRRPELLRTVEMLDWQQKFAPTLTSI